MLFLNKMPSRKPLPINQIKLCMDLGINLNRGFEEACYHGNSKIINLLHKYCNPNYENSIINACYSGNLELVQYLEQFSSITNTNLAFFNACYSNNYELINYILNKGVSNINIGLHGTFTTGNFELFKYFFNFVTQP